MAVYFYLLFLSYVKLSEGTFGVNGDYLVAAGFTQLLDPDPGFDASLFDANVSTCISVDPDNPIRLDFITSAIVTAIILVPFNLPDNATVQSYGGVNSTSTKTHCGIIGEVGTLNSSDYKGAPYSICPLGIYSDFVLLETSNAFDACEIAIVGFRKPPAFIEEDFSYNFDFINEDGAWRPRVTLTWSQTFFLMCPDTILVQDFDVSVSTTDGDFTLENYENQRTILDVDSFVPNQQGTYNLSLTRVFVDNATYFPLSAELNGRIESDVFSTAVYRGPFCWVGECSDKSDSDCEEEFELLSNVDDNNGVWTPAVGKLGVCMMMRMFSNSSTGSFPLFEHPDSDYFAPTANDVNVSDIPEELQFENGSFCYQNCITKLYSFQRPEVFAGKVDITQAHCDYLNQLWCCETDWCFDPSDWLKKDPPVQGKQPCTGHLLDRELEVLDHLKDCIAPIPLSFYTFQSGEGATVTFEVPFIVTSFNYVNVKIYSQDGSLVRSELCNGSAPFLAPNEYNCTVGALPPSPEYFVRVQGHNPERDDRDSGGSNDGLTFLSHYWRNQNEIFVSDVITAASSVQFLLGSRQGSEIVQISCVESCSNIETGTGSNGTASVLFSGLESGVRHSFQVSAVYSTGDANQTEPVWLASCTRPLQPLEVQFEPSASNSKLIEINIVTEAGSHWDSFVLTLVKPDSTNEVWNSSRTETSVLVPDLDFNYTVRVVAQIVCDGADIVASSDHVFYMFVEGENEDDDTDNVMIALIVLAVLIALIIVALLLGNFFRVPKSCGRTRSKGSGVENAASNPVTDSRNTQNNTNEDWLDVYSVYQDNYRNSSLEMMEANEMKDVVGGEDTTGHQIKQTTYLNPDAVSDEEDSANNQVIDATYINPDVASDEDTAYHQNMQTAYINHDVASDEDTTKRQIMMTTYINPPEPQTEQISSF